MSFPNLLIRQLTERYQYRESIYMKKLIFLFLTIIFLTSCTKLKSISQDKGQQVETSQIVPPPQKNDYLDNQGTLAAEEELIANFFGLINNHQIPEAISLMSSQAVPDDSTKQAWGVHFNTIRSVNIINMEAISQDTWTETQKVYKVTLEIYVDEKAANASIPYYGWEDNPNIRFITVVKGIDNLWKIDQIGTGL